MNSNTIQGMFEKIRLAVSSLLSRTDERRRKGAGLGTAAPLALVKRVCRMVDKASVSWGGGVTLYPNSIRVTLGPEPWDAYYCRMLRSSQDLLCSRVVEHINRKAGDVGPIVVRIALDTSLVGCRTRITTMFDERIADPTKTPEILLNSKRARRLVEQEDEFAEVDYPQVVSGGEARKPGSREVAHGARSTSALVYNGRRYVVHPGDTIGCHGGVSGESPTILLPQEQCPAMSRIHGRFGKARDGVWTYTNLGRNGTVLVSGNSERLLGVGVAARVGAGDTLYLGSRSTELSLCL